MIDIPYNEPSFTPAAPDVRVETVFGAIPQVTTAPTWTPRTFKDGFAYYVSGATYRFYVYDFTNHAWRYTALT